MRAAVIEQTNTITPTQTLFVIRPVLAAYLKIHGESNAQIPSTVLHQLAPGDSLKLETRAAPIRNIKAPTIQLFQAVGLMYAP
jgi:hypothetical protein